MVIEIEDQKNLHRGKKNPKKVAPGFELRTHCILSKYATGCFFWNVSRGVYRPNDAQFFILYMPKSSSRNISNVRQPLFDL